MSHRRAWPAWRMMAPEGGVSSRRCRGRLLAPVLAALLVWCLPSVLRDAGAEAEPLAVTSSGLDGGGFQNVVAVDPSGSGLVVAGGDVSGFHRSADWGTTWSTANQGISELDQMRVAALAFSPTVADKVYAGVGFKGTGGGLLVSIDGARSWALRSTAVQFSGTNNEGIPAIPPKHPRPTGNLLGIDGARGLLYAATFDDGLMRSSDDGQSWQVLGLAGKYLRSIAMAPTSADVLYVSAYGEGVFRVADAASETPTVDLLVGSPVATEELLALETGLYAAAGPEGVVSTTDGGVTWAPLGSGSVPTNGPTWISINGYVGCSGTVLYAGADKAGAKSLMRSTDGGATWASLVADPARIHTEVGGPGGDPWWLASNTSLMLGGASYTAASIGLQPPDPSDSCQRPRLLVAGRSGVWRSTDAGTEWYPAVRGMGVSIVDGVAADPRVAGRVYMAAADWGLLYSTDDGRHVTRKSPPNAAWGFDVAVETSVAPGRVYVATGAGSGNTDGEVYSSPDPTTSGWTAEGLSSVAGGGRPLAIAVRKVSGARIVLAAVEGAGVWRKSGTRWTKVSSTAMASRQPTVGASFAWASGSKNVYLYDRQTGVWRSKDNGVTWLRIWQKPSPERGTGYLLVDPGVTSRLFVSSAEGVHRLDGAVSGTVESGSLVPLRVGPFTRPGPMAAGPSGAIFAAERPRGGSLAAFYRTLDGGQSWEDMADDTYRGTAVFPSDLAFGSTGTGLMAQRGNGVLLGLPAP